MHLEASLIDINPGRRLKRWNEGLKCLLRCFPPDTYLKQSKLWHFYRETPTREIFIPDSLAMTSVSLSVPNAVLESKTTVYQARFPKL